MSLVLGVRVHFRMKVNFCISFKAKIHDRVAIDVMARFILRLS